MVKSLDEVIERLQYKADNIKAKLEPSYFTECIEYLKSIIPCYLGSPCEYQTEDVNYNHGWVACSERFPEKNIFVLVSMRDGHMYVAKHVDKVRVGIFECEWKTLGSYFGTEDVLAWRPLPSPYEQAEQMKGEV